MSPGWTKRIIICCPWGVAFTTLSRPCRSTKKAVAFSPWRKTAVPLGTRCALAWAITSSSSASPMALNTGSAWIRVRSRFGIVPGAFSGIAWIGPLRLATSAPQGQTAFRRWALRNLVAGACRVYQSAFEAGQAGVLGAPQFTHQRDPLLVRRLLSVTLHCDRGEGTKL